MNFGLSGLCPDNNIPDPLDTIGGQTRSVTKQNPQDYLLHVSKTAKDIYILYHWTQKSRALLYAVREMRGRLVSTPPYLIPCLMSTLLTRMQLHEVPSG